MGTYQQEIRGRCLAIFEGGADEAASGRLHSRLGHTARHADGESLRKLTKYCVMGGVGAKGRFLNSFLPNRSSVGWGPQSNFIAVLAAESGGKLLCWPWKNWDDRQGWQGAGVGNTMVD